MERLCPRDEKKCGQACVCLLLVKMIAASATLINAYMYKCFQFPRITVECGPVLRRNIFTTGWCFHYYIRTNAPTERHKIFSPLMYYRVHSNLTHGRPRLLSPVEASVPFIFAHLCWSEKIYLFEFIEWMRISHFSSLFVIFIRVGFHNGIGSHSLDGTTRRMSTKIEVLITSLTHAILTNQSVCALAVIRSAHVLSTNHKQNELIIYLFMGCRVAYTDKCHSYKSLMY